MADTNETTAATAAAEGNDAPDVQIDNISTFWLEASAHERYLLLEDGETGDVLMPLIYMKNILEVNYSRKLASLKHRVVSIPAAAKSPLEKHQELLAWQWAFESPSDVKATIFQSLGEVLPQGHLRLVLVPIVYNALAAREDLRSTPLFAALHRAMRISTYWPLLKPLVDSVLSEADARAGIAIQPGTPLPPTLFNGPKMLEITAGKYMILFKDRETMQSVKRKRTTTGASWVDQSMLAAIASGSHKTDLVTLLAKTIAESIANGSRNNAALANAERAARRAPAGLQTSVDIGGLNLLARNAVDFPTPSMAPPPEMTGAIAARLLIDAQFQNMLAEFSKFKGEMLNLYLTMYNIAAINGEVAEPSAGPPALVQQANPLQRLFFPQVHSAAPPPLPLPPFLGGLPHLLPPPPLFHVPQDPRRPPPPGQP